MSVLYKQYIMSITWTYFSLTTDKTIAATTTNAVIPIGLILLQLLAKLRVGIKKKSNVKDDDLLDYGDLAVVNSVELLPSDFTLDLCIGKLPIKYYINTYWYYCYFDGL